MFKRMGALSFIVNGEIVFADTWQEALIDFLEMREVGDTLGVLIAFREAKKVQQFVHSQWAIENLQKGVFES